jgi:hypothetical protein
VLRLKAVKKLVQFVCPGFSYTLRFPLVRG